MAHLFPRKLSIVNRFPRLLAACFSLFASPSLISASPPDDSPVFSKCWEYPSAADVTVNPTSDDTNVYFLDNENRLVGVHLHRGTKVWSTELGGDVISNLLVTGESILVVTSVPASASSAAKSILWSLRTETGLTDWRTDISPSPAVTLGRSSGNILALGSDGVVTAVSLGGGPLWSIQAGSPLSSEPIFDDIGVAFGTEKNEVLNIAGSDGRVDTLWKSQHAPTAVYLNSRTRLLVGDARGNVFSLPGRSNPAWRFRNGARISKVIGNKVGYLAVSDDNFVYNLSRSGDVKWKRRLSGRVAGSPLVLGDALVLSIAGAGTVYVLDLRKGKISNRIDTGEESSIGSAGLPSGEGFVTTAPTGLTYFSRVKCPAK
jgi:outer membrane protein assembly factor BamB